MGYDETIDMAGIPGYGNDGRKSIFQDLYQATEQLLNESCDLVADHLKSREDGFEVFFAPFYPVGLTCFDNISIV